MPLSLFLESYWSRRIPRRSSHTPRSNREAEKLSDCERVGAAQSPPARPGALALALGPWPPVGRGGTGRGGARVGRGQSQRHSLAHTACTLSCSLPGLCSRLTAGVAPTSRLLCAQSPRRSGSQFLNSRFITLGGSCLFNLSFSFLIFLYLLVLAFSICSLFAFAFSLPVFYIPLFFAFCLLLVISPANPQPQPQQKVEFLGLRTKLTA